MSVVDAEHERAPGGDRAQRVAQGDQVAGVAPWDFGKQRRERRQR